MLFKDLCEMMQRNHAFSPKKSGSLDFLRPLSEKFLVWYHYKVGLIKKVICIKTT